MNGAEFFKISGEKIKPAQMNTQMERLMDSQTGKVKTDNPLQSKFARGYKHNTDLKIHSSANHNMVVI